MPRLQSRVQKRGRLKLNDSIEFGQSILRLPTVAWVKLARLVRCLFTWIDKPVKGLARKADAFDRLESRPRGDDLLADYRVQVSMLALDRRERHLLESSIALLEPSGNLSPEIAEAFAASLSRIAGGRVTTAEAAGILERLHRLDPPAGWTTKVELLLLVHRRSAGYRPGDPVERLLLQEPLEEGEIEEAKERILRDLSPALHDRTDTKESVRPDEMVGPPEIRFMLDGRFIRVTDAKGTPIDSNDFHSLNPHMLDSWRSESLDPRVRRTLVSFVMRVVRSGQYRLETLKHVAEAIADLQADHFRGKRPHPVPMTYGDVAESTGISRSVICRAMAGKSFIDPAETTRPFRSLFSGKAKVPHRRLGEIDRASVIDEIRRIVHEEDPGRPMFDVEIAEILRRQGVSMSLSGVRKYRRLAGIEPRARRR